MSFTAAGLFGTFTRFPFNPLPVCLGSRNQFDGKDRAFSVRTKQEGRRFFATSFPTRINTFVRTCRYRRTDASPRACGHVRTTLRTRPYEALKMGIDTQGLAKASRWTGEKKLRVPFSKKFSGNGWTRPTGVDRATRPVAPASTAWRLAVQHRTAHCQWSIVNCPLEGGPNIRRW